MSGVEELVNYLLFSREAQSGEVHVDRVREAILVREFLPPAPIGSVEDDYGTLTQPRPDHAVGYITMREAAPDHVTAPLTKPEERVVLKDPVMTNLHFPFLTCQWKSAKGSQNLWHAERQGARDGATIVNYMHHFYTAAGIKPSVVDTCHWSLTCDMRSTDLFVHWRDINEDGEVEYYMECVQNEHLNKAGDPENSGMALMRQRLHNVREYALDERLKNIKAAIRTVKAGFTPKPKLKPRSSKASSSKPPPSEEGFYQGSDSPRKKRLKVDNGQAL